MMNLKHLFLTARKEMKANENLLTEKSNIFIIIGLTLFTTQDFDSVEFHFDCRV